MSTAAASRTRSAVWLLALMAFVSGLALFFFNGQSLRLDEAQSLWQTSREPLQVLTTVGKDVHVPLYHMLLHTWRVFFGDSVETARLLSLVWYLLSIPALYMLGKLAYGRGAGLFAATLLAVSPFMNWYGSEIRMYTLFTLLVILNQYSFIKLFRGGSDHAWAAYVITAVLGIFSHYFFFLVLVGQAVFYYMRRALFPSHANTRFLASWGLVGLAFLPWVIFVFSLGEALNQEPLLSAPTTVNLFSTLSQFVFGFQDDHLNTFFLSLWPLAIVLGFLSLRKSQRIMPETEYFMLSVIMAVSLAFFASLLIEPVFVSRYLILAVPSLYLLLTSLISGYSLRARTAVGGALVVLMLVTLALEITNPATPVKENYREATEYLNQHVGPQDIVVLSAPFTVYPVEYYYRGAAPVATLPLWDRYAFGPIPPFSEDNLPEEVALLTSDHQYAWVLLSYDQGYEQDVRDYFDTHFERVEARTFSPGLTLLVYKLRYDTPLARSAGP